MTVDEAIAAMRAGDRVSMTVEPNHIMHVWIEDGVVFHEAQQPAWSAGVIEPVCGADRPYLREYLGRGYPLALVKRARR